MGVTDMAGSAVETIEGVISALTKRVGDYIASSAHWSRQPGFACG